MLWVFGVAKTVDFIDGLDGLAAGVCAICAADPGADVRAGRRSTK